jgi:hypothetical protein
VTARQIALAHLRLWMTAAEELPAGAAWLEPVDSPGTSWAVRHPSTGALFGWHADPERLAALYWETLPDDCRCELVAAAVAALKDGEHRLAWKLAWSNWTQNADARHHTVERAVIAWVEHDPVGLDDALSALSEEVFPDDPPAPGDQDPALQDPPAARLALDLANAALLSGQADLGHYLYVYAAAAGSDRRQIPALLSTLRAVLDHLDFDNPAPTSAADPVAPLGAPRPS